MRERDSKVSIRVLNLNHYKVFLFKRIPLPYVQNISILV